MPLRNPVNGVRYAVRGDAASIPQHTKNINDDLLPVLPTRFATTAARDAAVKASSFTPAGIPEGFRAYIIGSGWTEWDGVGWVKDGVQILATLTYPAGPFGASAANNQRPVSGVAARTYTLNRQRNIEVSIDGIVSGDTVGSQYRLYLADELGQIDDIRDYIVSLSGGRYLPSIRTVPMSRQPGTHTLTCTWELTAGGGTVFLNALTVTVMDVGPA